MSAVVFRRETIRPDKIEAVDTIGKDMSESQSIVFADYCGLTVSEINALRRELSEAGVVFKVIKNTLARIAADKQGLTDTQKFFTGPTAVAYGKTDPLAPAKIIFNFAKQNKKITIKGGVLEREILTTEEVEALAVLPGRVELLTMLVRVLASPISGFMIVLEGNVRNLVRVLDEIRKKKE